MNYFKKLASFFLDKKKSSQTGPIANGKVDYRWVDSRLVGLRDASLSGWFNDEEGVLVKGFDVSANDVVLDIGCGEGGVTKYCAKYGPHIIISDIDADKVAKLEIDLNASNARKVDAYVSDCSPLPLADESVTRVIAMEMLEHVNNPEAIMAEIVRVAVSGAKILLSVPTESSEFLQQELAPKEYFSSPNHIRIFSEDSFIQLIEGSGLVVEHQIKWGFFWTIWMSLHWVVEKNSGRSLDGAALDRVTPPYSQVLDDWALTWNQLINMPEGQLLKQKLDETLPKAIAIIARKP
jgi:SAM-dependent methyltransferase